MRMVGSFRVFLGLFTLFSVETSIATLPAFGAEFPSDAEDCVRTETDNLGVVRFLENSLSQILSIIPVKLADPAPEEGLQIDIVPTAYFRKNYFEDHRGTARTMASNDDYYLNFLGMQLFKRKNKVLVSVDSMKDFEYFLSSLPDRSVKEIRILAHMSDGAIDGLSLWEHSDNLTRVRVKDKFQTDASIKLIGCSFAGGEKGLKNMQEIAENYLSTSGGKVIAFEDSSWQGAAYGAEKLFTISFGNVGSNGPRYEYRIQPNGLREMVKIDAFFNDSN